MKLTNWFVNKLGSDKVMHFLGGGWLVSLFSPFGWMGIFIGLMVTLILSLVKEWLLDNSFDWGDIFAALGGSVVSSIAYLIMLFIL